MSVIAVVIIVTGLTKTFINLFFSFPLHTLLCLPNPLLQFPVSTSDCVTCVLWFDDMWLLLTALCSLIVDAQYLEMSGIHFVHLLEEQRDLRALALIVLKILPLFCLLPNWFLVRLYSVKMGDESV